MPEIHTKKAELIHDAKAMLGEGPVWDPRQQALFWVDIEGKQLHRHNPVNNSNQHWNFEGMIGAAVPSENDSILLALESGMASYNIETETLTPHEALKNENPEMRYNDGKVGPNGNFWIGSMHKRFKPGSGNLYRVDSEFNTTLQIPGTTISNGMAWSADKKSFYYIDSDAHEVYTYEFDASTSSITNKSIAFKVPKSYGSADGMCIDVEGMLWIAHWGGNCVRRWNPKTGTVLETIEVAAPHVTSCCFGGKELDTLYITSARSDLNKEQLNKYPLSGGLFTYKPGIQGMPITYFKNN